MHLIEIHGPAQGYKREVQQSTNSNVESKIHIETRQIPQPLFEVLFGISAFVLESLYIGHHLMPSLAYFRKF